MVCFLFVTNKINIVVCVSVMRVVSSGGLLYLRSCEVYMTCEVVRSLF